MILVTNWQTFDWANFPPKDYVGLVVGNSHAFELFNVECWMMNDEPNPIQIISIAAGMENTWMFYGGYKSVYGGFFMDAAWVC